MTATTEREIETLRGGGRRLAALLAELVGAVRPGVATLDLDRLAERLIREAGGTPAFKGYRAEAAARPFPAAICTSINDELVHGIPRRGRVLREGDLLGIDVGMRWPAGQLPATSYQLPADGVAMEPRASSRKLEAGLITDMAITVPVGEVSAEARRLLRATREALREGIRVLRAGVRLGDVGHAIQRRIEADGFGVVRELVGHGVGERLHEPPYVPNYGTPGVGAVIRAGMVLAIEPMATAGKPAVALGRDGWTWHTRDGSLAAHFEHTVLVTEQGAEILTARPGTVPPTP